MIRNPRLDWGKLLTEDRLPKADDAAKNEPDWLVHSRTETERDFDRILFATPTRRLGDKTQVFPLDRTESVRNRLTHSHEVSNLARSVGTYFVHSPLFSKILKDAGSGVSDQSKLMRAIPAMLAAAGLAHDLGNPPFGHQGEEAIRSWISRNEKHLWPDCDAVRKNYGGFPEPYRLALLADVGRMNAAHRADFLCFEGNAQTIRTLTRLQVVKDDRGLNLTFGTLAALMKYTVGSCEAKGKQARPSERKCGFFESEAGLVRKIRAGAGLGGTIRHPLAYLIEACDDIAYLVVDAEDAIKKRVVSFHDLIAWLRSKNVGNPDLLIGWLTKKGEMDAAEARNHKVPPSEVSDVSMQVFRANAISAMISAVINEFERRYDEIMTVGLDRPLLDESIAARLAEALKEFDVEHAYKNRRVLEIELTGYNTIQELMSMLWQGIVERESFVTIGSQRTSPFARYAYGRISENYRRVFEQSRQSPQGEDPLPVRYREVQLLTDMIAGMTDRFAMDLYRELKEFHVAASPAN